MSVEAVNRPKSYKSTSAKLCQLRTILAANKPSFVNTVKSSSYGQLVMKAGFQDMLEIINELIKEENEKESK